eukprot:6197467-Pleurochrysis_carterae.AAC.1
MSQIRNHATKPCVLIPEIKVKAMARWQLCNRARWEGACGTLPKYASGVIQTRPCGSRKHTTHILSSLQEGEASAPWGSRFLVPASRFLVPATLLVHARPEQRRGK